MTNKVFEEVGGPHRGHAAGDTDIEKQASQLASDVKYKVRKEMGDGSHMSPAQVTKAYLQKLASSPAPSAVKVMAKKKLMGEDYYTDLPELVERTISNVMYKVFVEGISEVEENIEIVDEEVREKKYKVRVTDKETGNSYVTNATRSKIAELRANPNISSVEMTGYGEPIKSEKTKGKQTASVKAGKGLDPVGKEDGDIDNDGDRDKTDKYLLNRRKVRGKAIETQKEEFIGEVKKTKEDKNKVQETGVNNYKSGAVKMFPELKEQSPSMAGVSIPKTEVDKAKASTPPVDANKRKQEQINDRVRQQEIQILQRKMSALRSAPRGSDPSITASYEPDGETIEETDEFTIKKIEARRKLFAKQNKKVETKSASKNSLSYLPQVQKSHYEPEGDQLDEKITAKTDMGTAIKDFYASKSPQLAGRTKEQRRQAAIAAVLTARRGGKKLGEECDCDEEPKLKKSEGSAEDPREIPTKVNLVKNKLRAMGLKMSYEPEGEIVDEAIAGLRPASERTKNAITPAQRKKQEQERKRKEELAHKANLALAGMKNTAKPGAVTKSETKSSAPEANRKLKAGKKVDTLAVKANKVISSSYELEGEVIDELRRSEKEGKGSPDTSREFISRAQRKERGPRGAVFQYSGNKEFGSNRNERGKKKNEPGSQHQRLNPLEKKGRQLERGSAAARQRWHSARD
jgi:hypothetical protein